MNKRIWALTLLVSLSLTIHLSMAGGRSDGGGDICEDRFKVVRDDLANWVNNGGPKNLKLPSNISLEQYTSSMSKQFSQAKIRCVSKKDAGYPVQVDGTPKTCRFDQGDEVDQITCDTKKFLDTAQADQYVLVHHEYAGLAGIEMPRGDDSTYVISNQLTGFLADQVIKKLVVKPLDGKPSVFDSILQITTAGPNLPKILFAEVGQAIPDPSSINYFPDGFITHARNMLQDQSSDTYGREGNLTLRVALADLAAELDISEFRRDLSPDYIDYRKIYLEEFSLYSASPEVATGLTSDEIDRFDLIFQQKLIDGHPLWFTFRYDGKNVRIEDDQDGSLIGSGKTFADAFRAAIAKVTR